MPVWVYWYHMSAVPVEARRGPWIFSNWIDWQLWVARHKCWELNPDPLQDWQVLFIRKWSVQPSFSVYLGTVVLMVTRVHLAILAEHDCEAPLDNSSIHASYTCIHLLLASGLSVTPGKGLFHFNMRQKKMRSTREKWLPYQSQENVVNSHFWKRFFKKCKSVEERLLLSHDFKTQSIMVGKAHRQECEVAGYIIFTCRKDAAA